MFIVLLRFSNAKSRASELMAAHNEWIERGFEEGVFLLVGSVQPSLGGAILVRNASRGDLAARIREDPFVIHDVVKAEVLEVSPSRTDPQLAFLRA
jgi:uncharacterized protein YciI